MIRHFDIAIVGTGHAGAQAAASLRQGGFTGSIGLIGAEDEPPYDRPSLSKDYLAGRVEACAIRMRPADFWAARDITLVPGTRIVQVDAAAHRLSTGTGAAIGYGRMLWAAGGTARRLTCPGAGLAGLHTIRHRHDVDALRADLGNGSSAAGRRVVVIGAGFIGLEAAGVLSQAGHRVTVVEAQDRVLARVAGRLVARHVETVHRDQGVEIRLGAVVRSLAADAARRVSAVVLADGEHLPADLVIAGIGLEPVVAPLPVEPDAAGGIAVDGQGRTALPDIWAAGDCAAHVNRYAGGRRIRLESVQNAVDQARVAAAAMLGGTAIYDAVPRFWSTQYDMRLQTVGLQAGHDVELMRGDPAAGSFSVVYLRQGRVIAIDGINAPQDLAQGRLLVQAQADPAAAPADPQALADPAVPLKALIQAPVMAAV